MPSYPSRFFIFSNITIAMMVVFLHGCGSYAPKFTKVSGKALMGDKPLTGMAIRFYEKRQGQGAVMNLDQEGNFHSNSPISLGTYQISLAPRQPDSQKDQPGEILSPAPPEGVPKAYLESSTSGISVTVSEGQHDFDLVFRPDGPPTAKKTNQQLRSFQPGE